MDCEDHRGMVLDDVPTYDHLYPKGHPLRGHGKNVLACYECNFERGEITHWFQVVISQLNVNPTKKKKKNNNPRSLARVPQAKRFREAVRRAEFVKRTKSLGLVFLECSETALFQSYLDSIQRVVSVDEMVN